MALYRLNHIKYINIFFTSDEYHNIPIHVYYFIYRTMQINTNAIVEGSTSLNVICNVTIEPSIQTWIMPVKNVEIHLVERIVEIDIQTDVRYNEILVTKKEKIEQS